MTFPLVSRKKYVALYESFWAHDSYIPVIKEQYRKANADLIEAQAEIAVLNAKIAEYEDKENSITREIEQVEKSIVLEELKNKLAKMRSEPEPESVERRGRPTVDKVLEVAARMRKQRSAK